MNNVRNAKFPFCLLALLTVLTLSCESVSFEGGLVPATVIDDARLPRVTLKVAGADRQVHFRSYGAPGLPVLLVIHGSLSDMRAYMPFRVFSDRYRVVFWDMRGNGLSERVPKEELSPDHMVEEIHAIKNLVSPDRPVSILGHSWSAVFAACYLARYPGEVREAVLMEPFGLRDRFMDNAGGVLNLTRSGYLDMAWSSGIVSPLDHARLDWRTSGMLKSAVREFHVDNDNPPDWPFWRVGGLALITWEASILDASGAYFYDFTPGLGDFHGPVLLVGSSHSPIGADFQARYHLALFQNASLLRIAPSGHRMITEQWAQLENGIRAFLAEYAI